MRTVYILVEGPTEEEFINSVLGPYLKTKNIPNIIPIGIETSPGFTGGDLSYKRYHLNVNNLLIGDYNAIVTSIIDFYELRKDFPGYTTATGSSRDKVEYIENEMANVIVNDRFIPYIQLHEFEGILFSHIKGFQEMPRAHLGRAQYIINQFANPEDINDGPATIPAERLKQIIPRYKKTFHGPLIAISNGIIPVLEKCPRFRNWVNTIIIKATS